MLDAHNRSFRARRVRNKSALYFSRTYAMARNVDNVIHSTGYPVVTIVVSPCPVTAYVVTFKWLEICCLVSRMVTIDSAHY